MTSLPSVRKRLVATMARLLRKQGFAATGLNQLVAESGAPKGSLYHYFPGGKDEVAAEALRFAAALVHDTLKALRRTERSPAGIVRAYGALLEGWMAKSGYSDGCPITTTLLEVATAKPAIAEIGGAAFAGWQAVFAEALRDAGVEATRAKELGLAAIMMFEGALILSRVQRDPRPIRVATQEIVSLFERVGLPHHAPGGDVLHDPNASGD